MTTTSKTKEKAKNHLLAEIEAAAKAGTLTTKGLNAILGHSKVNVPVAAEAFLDALKNNASSPTYIHQATGVLKRFIDHQGLLKTPIGDVTEANIYAFINDDRGSGATWRKTQLSILRSLFSLAVHREWRTGNPAKLVKVQMHKLKHKQKEKKIAVAFTDKEVDKLLSMLYGEIAVMETELETTGFAERKGLALRDARFWFTAIALGRYTGVRLGDIAQMEHDSLAVPRKIIVWTDKRDRRVALPLKPPLLAQAIAAIPPVSMTYLFPEFRDIYLDPNRRSNLSTYFRRICDKAGIKNRTFHDLRRRYVEACFESGMPIEHISERVGHSHTSTTVDNYMPTYKDVIKATKKGRKSRR